MLQPLTKAVQQLGLELTTTQLEQLVELQQQLQKWTKTFNLTAITNNEQVLTHHLLDSLALVPYWRFDKTLDVGTGAGFPGLPLAIALPDKQFHLLDSNSKKIRFIRQQIHYLDLKNVVTHHSRVEQLQLPDKNEQAYDCIVSRAFASLSDMVNLTHSLLAADGRWIAMKGIYSKQEIDEIPPWVKEVSCLPLSIPGLDAQRCLIELARRND